MTSPQDAQMRARVLATAHVARAIVMLEREIAQNTTGVLEADDLAANFERLGVRELDVPYIFARLGGNLIDPIVELVVSPCLTALAVPPAAEGDLPAPDAETLREWAGIPPAEMKPKGWSRSRPRKTAFDRSMPAPAFRAVVAAFAEITFAPPALIASRNARHLDLLRALMPADEAALFIELAAAASIAAVLKKVVGGQGPASTDDAPRLH